MKIKVNVGCSSKRDPVALEIEKINYGVAREVDYISEISLVPDKKLELLQHISSFGDIKSKFCTVPLYDAVLTQTPLLDIVKFQISKGIKAFTFHLTPQYLIKKSVNQKFVINSRAGNFLHLLDRKNLENPHFAIFPELIELLRSHQCEMFIGTSLRPGRVEESKTSRLWIEEILFIKSFLKSHSLNTSDYILECGGHLDRAVLDSFADLVKEEQICAMGPLLTDATNGFDDVSSVLGATLLNAALPLHTHLMLTRDEHIRLPTLDAFKKGTDQALLLKHNINLYNRETDTQIIEQKFRNQSNQCTIGVNLFGPLEGDPEVCTMCGNHCPLRNIKYPHSPLEKSKVFQVGQ